MSEYLLDVEMSKPVAVVERSDFFTIEELPRKAVRELFDGALVVGDELYSKRYVESLEKRISDLEAQIPRWIPVAERLPECGHAVLVVHQSGWICTMGWIVLGQKINEPDPEYGKRDRPTHWMNLPSAPGVNGG